MRSSEQGNPCLWRNIWAIIRYGFSHYNCSPYARDSTNISIFIFTTHPGFTLTAPTFGLHQTPLTCKQKEDNMKHVGTLLRYTLTKPYLFMNSPDDVCGLLVIHNIFSCIPLSTAYTWSFPCTSCTSAWSLSASTCNAASYILFYW